MGDYTRENVLYTLQLSDVGLRRSMQQRVAVVYTCGHQGDCDMFCVIVRDAFPYVTQSSDVMMCRFADTVDVFFERQRFVDR